jgi:GDPmannose 4,6-dehydratase
MKALIYGANGQDGFYLNQLGREKKIVVTDVSRSYGNWEQGSVSDFNFVVLK